MAETTTSERINIALAGTAQQLAGNWLSPADGGAHATVVIAPAMATKANFYLPFAQWLAGQGFEVLTFDYRGYGKSAGNQRLSEVTASALDWANDAQTAVEFARARNPEKPILYLGHSFGGQLVPLLESGDISGAVLVATGSGFWRCSAPRVRLGTPILWWLLSPLLIKATGYFPGGRIGIIGDLPPKVMTQWSRWCRSPRYITSESKAIAERYRRSTTPMTSIWFTDDELLAERSFTDFVGYFGAQPPALAQVKPSDLDVTRIGHHGIFQRAHETNGWPTLLLPHIQRLLEQSTAPTPQ